MVFHPVLLVLHILSGVVWLSFLPADIFFRQSISKASRDSEEKSLILLYIRFGDLVGRIGLTGIIITGVLMIIILPYYGFFSFVSNHWLAAKQVIIVIIIFLVGAFLIPLTKKIKVSLLTEGTLTDDFHRNYSKFTSVLSIINLLVLINFLFAITHRFFG